MTTTEGHTARPTVARWTAVGFAVAGLLLLLFPVLRPWPDETEATPALAEAFASDRWIYAHLFGIAGFFVLATALLGLRSLLSGTAGFGAATWAWATAWAGAAASSLYYGAEMFGIHVIAEVGVVDGGGAFLDQVTDLREQPVAVTLFGIGLVLLAAAGVLVAVALWRAGAVPPWAGVPLAAALVLYLPQFFGGPALRITHGVLIGAGCLLVAAVAGRRTVAR